MGRILSALGYQFWQSVLYKKEKGKWGRGKRGEKATSPIGWSACRCGMIADVRGEEGKKGKKEKKGV